MTDKHEDANWVWRISKADVQTRMIDIQFDSLQRCISACEAQNVAKFEARRLLIRAKDILENTHISKPLGDITLKRITDVSQLIDRKWYLARHVHTPNHWWLGEWNEASKVFVAECDWTMDDGLLVYEI